MSMPSTPVPLDPVVCGNLASACWAIAHRLTVIELAVHGLAGTVGGPPHLSEALATRISSIALLITWCRDDLGLVQTTLDDL